jgi:hypothetical protein
MVNKLLINVWQLLKTRSRLAQDVRAVLLTVHGSAFTWWGDGRTLTPEQLMEETLKLRTWLQAGSSFLGEQGRKTVLSRRMKLSQAGRGLRFDLSLSLGSLSPNPRLRNMFWKLFLEGTRPFGDSLFLDSQCKCLDSDDIQGCVAQSITWLVTEF